MKEKLKKICKNLIIFIFWLLMILSIYSIIYEQDKIAIDRYNFKQYEKLKSFVDSNYNKELEITDLWRLVYKYKLDIRPIKNCYYIVTTNIFEDYKWESKYIIWFKIESILYKIRYFHWYYYVYPKYDLPVWYVAGMNLDSTYSSFMRTISNPCQY